MQFVVLLELISTVTLPAAVIFTVYLVVQTVLHGIAATLIPMIILITILTLPAILITVTTREFSYVLYMFVYILAIPIW